jgi:methylated-DNA-[protein]-cysteine S-methyltransferase
MIGKPRKVYIGCVSGGPPKRVWVATSDDKVVQVALGATRSQFISRLNKLGFIISRLDRDRPRILAAALAQIKEYLFENRKVFDVALDFGQVSDFYKKVYKTLKKIPSGKTITYGQLGQKAGYIKAARAVGNAMNANPLPLFIPCHRVVACNGIGGFGCGPQMKLELLQLEGVDVE